MKTMGKLSNLSPWDETTYGNKVKTLRVLVECEKDSTCKYEYDDANDMMVVVRQLYKKYSYPYSYGSVPQTLAEDGDSLDAIVVSDEPIRSGTVINCLPLAIVRMIDNGEGDDKLICTPFYVNHGEIDVHKIINYLSNYKYPYQDGTEIVSIGGVDAAINAIDIAHKRFLGEL